MDFVFGSFTDLANNNCQNSDDYYSNMKGTLLKQTCMKLHIKINIKKETSRLVSLFVHFLFLIFSRFFYIICSLSFVCLSFFINEGSIIILQNSKSFVHLCSKWIHWIYNLHKTYIVLVVECIDYRTIEMEMIVIVIENVSRDLKATNLRAVRLTK